MKKGRTQLRIRPLDFYQYSFSESDRTPDSYHHHKHAHHMQDRL
ncbi:hypothetical protein VCRA2133E348_120010 [Vibrio crassostreae]|nr:hypothetical protein VCRA2119O48_30011 [Vibrio crassostreae]CAK2652382.1 hypothetical protein VCRA2133E348_120010 [Vibrio crassostreae]CAK3112504.1 hypothetical protein VCRA213O314_100011 [Vibrio crassostreae]CAK3662171.1 hypothetical protein VCRA2123O74_10011 [Vibrio crassostreae]